MLRKTLAVWVTVVIVLGFILVWAYFVYKRYLAPYLMSNEQTRSCRSASSQQSIVTVPGSRWHLGWQLDAATNQNVNQPSLHETQNLNILTNLPPSYENATDPELNDLPPSYEEATQHMQQQT